jgi:hypothetical protein
MREGATTSMTNLRKGKNLGPVVVRKVAAKRRSQLEDSEAANGGPRTVQRVVEFPKPPTADDVISERIIFEVGYDRFAINWTAEIERLPPAGPVVERKQLAETRPFALRDAAAIKTGIENVPRSRRRTNGSGWRSKDGQESR